MAKFLVPDWHSRLWHRVVIPARQAPKAGRRVRQEPYARVDYNPQSGTKNLASDELTLHTLCIAALQLQCTVLPRWI